MDEKKDTPSEMLTVSDHYRVPDKKDKMLEYYLHFSLQKIDLRIRDKR